MTALPSRVVAFATLCALSVPAAAQQRERTVTWPKEVCDAAARLPVQQGGRVKPLHTFAGFQLLRLNGKRTFTTAWGERLTPIEWLLDCWFFPKQAWDYQCIVVDDVRVIEAIGLPGGAKKRRDRYSLRELEPAFSKLGELGKKLEEKDPKRRTTLDSQIFNLSQVVPQMRYALGFLRFARDPVVTTGVKPLAEMFPGREKVPFLEFMGRFAEFRTRAEKLESDESLRPVAELLYFAKDFGRYAAVIPPPAGSEVFSSPGDILHAMWTGVPVHQEQMRWMHRFEELVGKTQDLEGLGAGLVALQKDLREAGTGHFDYGKVDMEVRFYQADWFYKALYLFLFGFLVCAFLWFLSGLGNVTRGGARRMLRLASYGTAITLVVGGEALLIIGIVIRCILRGRPPVTTPYEV
ncbi:MAG: hypothetical protein KDC87_17865, partial [Planctomycetes bacterium]|nr:hypothetical protein [Planctomycetota bacterium]